MIASILAADYGAYDDFAIAAVPNSDLRMASPLFIGVSGECMSLQLANVLGGLFKRLDTCFTNFVPPGVLPNRLSVDICF